MSNGRQVRLADMAKTFVMRSMYLLSDEFYYEIFDQENFLASFSDLREYRTIREKHWNFFMIPLIVPPVDRDAVEGAMCRALYNELRNRTLANRILDNEDRQVFVETIREWFYDVLYSRTLSQALDYLLETEK